MAKNLSALDDLAACFGRLPGIGRRSAQRIAIYLAVNGGLSNDLEAALRKAGENLCCCSRCGSLTTPDADPCAICSDPSRDPDVLCVVESPSDVFLLENAGGYRGRYHVLMGRISPMGRQGPDSMRLDALRKRLDTEPIKEVVLALNSDVESEATAAYVRDMLADRPVRISRPAMGIPAGSGMAYSDPVTLARAIRGREPFAQ